MKRRIARLLSFLLILTAVGICIHVAQNPEEFFSRISDPPVAVTDPVINTPVPVISAEPIGDLEFRYDEIPAYSGDPWVEVNGSTPFFTGSDLEAANEVFETYSSLDDLGRCGIAYANLCQDLMPTAPRTDIGMIRPSGWQTIRYDDIIKDKYLYNRCHLIGFQLAGENANELNLITGTRALNIQGMLPFENAVADYIDETDNHVLYRVTPVFIDDELVARGVLMEGYSMEDLGDGICFCVFCYNNQPGIVIDYTNGLSWPDPDYVAKED